MLTVMEDKAVGDLWREWRDLPFGPQQDILALIRKLVEERQRCDQQLGWNAYDAKQLALRNFGIDEEEWPG